MARPSKRTPQVEDEICRRISEGETLLAICRDEGMPPPDPENTRTFAILQKFNRLNLLVPVNAMHMWNAAMESKACRLTALGEHYRRLVEKNRI